MPFDPQTLLRPRRKITGISAVLLPYTDGGAIDWAGFARLVGETAGAGLTPAVNMDTGYANLIDQPKLDELHDCFVAVKDRHGGAFLDGDGCK